MKKLILIVGKSGSGKDTIAQEVSKILGLPIALSFTTRPKREKETEGIEYEFITDEEFKHKLHNNEIAEHTSYNVSTNETWYYGLSKSQLEQKDYVLAIVNPDGKNQLEKIYKDSIVSILIETDDKPRLIRTLDRENNPNVNEICRRVLADSIDFKDITCDYITYNNESPIKAIQEVQKIIVNEMAGDCI